MKRSSIVWVREHLRLLVSSPSILYIGAFGLALVGQGALSNKVNGVGVILVFVAALILIFAAAAYEPQATTPNATSSDLTPPRWFYVTAALFFALGAFNLNADASFQVQDSTEYQFTDAGVIAWVASAICFLAAFWQPEKSLREWREFIGARLKDWRTGIKLDFSWRDFLLLAILALGAFFYFYRLDAIPAEMTSDHVEKLFDVNDILEGHAPVFFVRNTGREPLQFYLSAAIIQLGKIPLGHLALKLGTATIGWLTIALTYLLAREMFDETVGLFAAFFVAVSHWMVTLSRMGLRFPFTPFFAALAFLFLLRALKNQNRNDFLVAGIALGVGMYTYIPSRALPLLALAWLVAWYVVQNSKILKKQHFVLNGTLLFLLALVIFLPLLRFALDFPGQFWSRALTRVSDTETHIQTGIFPVFVSNLANLALMFNQTGDSAWPNNIPYSPAVDPIAGALIILGVGLALYRTLVRREIIAILLLIAFIATLLPSALSIAFPIENPSNVRTDGAIPFVAILVALPLAGLFRALDSTLSQIAHGRLLVSLLMTALLILMIYLNYNWYFFGFDESYRSFAQNTSEAAAVVNGFAHSTGDIQHAYHVAYPHWFDSRAIAIQIGDIRWHNYSLDASDLMNDTQDTSNLLFIVNPRDSENLARLVLRYPRGKTFTIKSRTPGKDFLAFFVSASP